MRTAIANARVFDGHGLTEPRTVVIDDDVIGTDPAGAREVDAGGATLLPGLIDAHVHLAEPADLATLARWGVTTGLDMACWPAERLRALRTAGTGADVRSPGLPAIGPAGPHSRMPGMPPEAIVTSADEARRHVAARVAEGVDYVKGVAEAPGQGGPPGEALIALVEAARAAGLRTVIHAATSGAWTLAVAAGSDVVTHLPRSGAIDDADVAALAAAGRIAVPTMTMMSGFGVPVDDLARDVRALRAAGVTVLAGTDANSAPGAPAPVPHGESLHRELELLVTAGLSPTEALRAATSGPAREFGLPDRGAIAPGLRADLVLVDGDPTADIAATRAIRAVWCAGREVAS